MSAETEASDTLLAAAAVTAIVSTRIYPDVVPQEQPLPCVAIARAGTEYVTTIHSGVPVAARVTLDVWCMAATRSGAEALADAVETAIGAAGFVPADRRPEFDPETGVCSTVIAVLFWQ